MTRHLSSSQLSVLAFVAAGVLAFGVAGCGSAATPTTTSGSHTPAAKLTASLPGQSISTRRSQTARRHRSKTKPDPARADRVPTPVSTTTTNARPTTTTVTSKHAALTADRRRRVRKRHHRPKRVVRPRRREPIKTTQTKTTTTTGPPPTMTTIAGTPGSPWYTGPDPEHCLQVSGLSDVRAGLEQNVWEGNFAGTSVNDTRAIIFLSGPYKSSDAATQYANSLQGIELASAGGRWVASAALTSKLDFQVKSTAACMGP